MKTSELVRMTVGSLLVYVVVAACSSDLAPPQSGVGGAPQASSGGDTASGGATAEDSEGVSGTTGQSSTQPNASGGAEGTSGVAVGGTKATSKSAAGGSRASGGSVGTTAKALGGGTSILNPVPVALADPTDGTRLKAKYQVGEDGSKVALYYVWWDSQRNEDCSFAATADGKTRCIPSGYTASEYFTDSACATSIILAAVLSTGDCPTSAPKYATSQSTNACTSGTAHIYPVAGLYSGSVYTKSGTTCVAQTSTPGITYTRYRVDDEIPLSSFVAGTIKTGS